jgi:hypothetical protein
MGIWDSEGPFERLKGLVSKKKPQQHKKQFSLAIGEQRDRYLHL